MINNIMESSTQFFQTVLQRRCKQKRISKASRRSSWQMPFQIQKYSKSELKCLMFLSLAYKFELRKKQIIAQYEEQTNQKMKNLQTHKFSVMAIQPPKKQIYQLNHFSVILYKLAQQVKQYLLKSLRQSNLNSTINQSNNSLLIKFSGSQKSLKELKIKNLVSSKNLKKQISFMTPNSNISPLKQNRQNGFSKSNSTLYNCKSTHRRVLSDKLWSPTVLNWKKKQSAINIYGSQLNSSIKKSQPNLFCISKKKQDNYHMKKICNDLNQFKKNTATVGSTLQLFLNSIHKANYMLNLVNCDFSERIFHYVGQLEQILKKISQILIFFLSKDERSYFRSLEYHKACTEKPRRSEFIEYFGLSNTIIGNLKVIITSTNFEKVVSDQKIKMNQLLALVNDSRFTLKYLEKEVQSLMSNKKNNPFLSQWQKAYLSKFTTKRRIY